jgi:Surface-adhesin protein E
MKRILITLMFALVSTSAMARWIAIGDGRDFPVTYYLDFETVHKQGQYVYVLELMDFDTPQEFKGAAWVYLSSILRIQFDCNEKQSRILSFRMYAGQMGTKENVYSANFPSAPWEPVPPDSVTKELWNSACVMM